MLFLSTLLSALAMWVMIWFLTRHETRISLRPLIWISLGMYLTSYFLVRQLEFIGLGISMAILIAALMYFCTLSLRRALLVAVVWIAVQVLFVYVIGPMY